MGTAKTAPGISRVLAQAAGQHAATAHVLARLELWLAAAAVAAVLAAAGWVVYRVSLWLHPFTTCRRCGGSGVTSGFVPWSRSFCRRCDGRGLVPRLGVKAAGAVRTGLPVTAPRAPAGPGLPAGGLRAAVLGSLLITGTAQELTPRQAELVVALALAGPGRAERGLAARDARRRP